MYIRCGGQSVRADDQSGGGRVTPQCAQLPNHFSIALLARRTFNAPHRTRLQLPILLQIGRQNASAIGNCFFDANCSLAGRSATHSLAAARTPSWEAECLNPWKILTRFFNVGANCSLAGRPTRRPTFARSCTYYKPGGRMLQPLEKVFFVLHLDARAVVVCTSLDT